MLQIHYYTQYWEDRSLSSSSCAAGHVFVINTGRPQLHNRDNLWKKTPKNVVFDVIIVTVDFSKANEFGMTLFQQDVIKI